MEHEDRPPKDASLDAWKGLCLLPLHVGAFLRRPGSRILRDCIYQKARRRGLFGRVVGSGDGVSRSKREKPG